MTKILKNVTKIGKKLKKKLLLKITILNPRNLTKLSYKSNVKFRNLKINKFSLIITLIIPIKQLRAVNISK